MPRPADAAVPAEPCPVALLERQEKLASLGVFATGIAHEIRNPLTAIKVRLFTLKNSHQPGTSEHEDLQVIGAEIDRLEHIVRDFLQESPPQPNREIAEHGFFAIDALPPDTGRATRARIDEVFRGVAVSELW